MESESKFVHQISADKYEQFGLELIKSCTEELNFMRFKEDNFCKANYNLAEKFFPSEMNWMQELLNNLEVGIVAIDVPETDIFTKEENTVLGSAIVMGLFYHLGTPNIDPINQLPFMMHTASHHNEQQIDSKGLTKLSPELKLGFHNDGLISSEEIEIPEHVMVYNLYISYHKPGNFMWIPTKLWNDAKQFEELIKNSDPTVKIKLNPNYHLDEKNEIVNTIHEYIEVPISKINEKGIRQFFLNGQVLLEDNPVELVKFVQSMRDSLANSAHIIYIPQRERRAFFIKNTHGFHARSVFEEPIENIDLTRVYLRAVDVNAELYSRIKK